MSLDFTFICLLTNGFHARPASNLADVANAFAGDCVMTNLRNGLVANMKSVLAIIAADVRMNDKCSVHVSAPDEVAASTALRRFIEEELPSCDQPLPAPVANGQTQIRVLPRALQSAGVSCHFGVGVSRGMAQGKVVILGGITLPKELSRERAADPRRERERIERASIAVRGRIESLLTRQVSATETAILRAHLAILGDVSLADRLTESIAKGQSAGQAVVEAGEYFIDLLRHSESLYIRERALDIQEICLQLLTEIYGPKFHPPTVELKGESIVVAETLAPQQLLALDRRQLRALVLGSAGTTSHTIILARSLGIPAVVDVKDAPLLLSGGQEVVVDANRGLIIGEWSQPVRRFYDREWKTLRRRQAALAGYTTAPAITADGRRIEVGANVSSTEELIPAFAKGADGIGLFRTEMLFVGRDSAPSEEEQLAAYVQAARAAGTRPVIIRTIDIGGDKPLAYLKLPKETNPFLGYRGVRIYPEHQELIRTQLRAILRASAFGRVQVMVPMVSSLSEVLWFKKQVAEIQSELTTSGVVFDPAMPIGVMIEVPSVALIIDQLCQEIDFFSIGTNDLGQYFLAVDRDNAKVAGLSSAGHPSFIRFLKQIVAEVHNGGKWAGMCGEMAGDTRNLPLLLGLGLDEISIAASEIPAVKEKISKLRAQDCEQLLSRAIACRDLEEVEELLDQDQPVEHAAPLLDSELVLLSSESESKEEAIREIVDEFYVAGRTEDPQRLEEAVWAREAVYSTGLGHGFAIPHCKTDAVAADSIGILRFKEPVQWDSLDGKPVQMVILLAMRESNANGRHMQVFSKLARKLMNEDFREHLLSVKDEKAALAYLAEELEVAA